MATKLKKDQPTDVLIAWCIDRSGSMQGLEDDTIGGFNAFVDTQRDLPGKAYLSLVLFDTTFMAPIVATDIKEVQPLDRSTYYIGGGTSLYDAVGVTINGVEGWLKNNPAFKGKVLVQIWTDGQENSSKRWPRYGGGLGMMMEAIKAKQDEGWTFSFLGTGGAAWTEGENFKSMVGVGNTSQFTNSGSGTRMSYATASAGATSLRSHGVYASNTSSIDAVTQDSQTLAAFGIDDVEEALAGTTNKEEEEG